MPQVVQESVIDTLDALQAARGPLARVRLIAGTTAILPDCIAHGTFSERLFYQLNIIHLVGTLDPSPATDRHTLE